MNQMNQHTIALMPQKAFITSVLIETGLSMSGNLMARTVQIPNLKTSWNICIPNSALQTALLCLAYIHTGIARDAMMISSHGCSSPIE
jgi:hypothetical protein